MDDDDATSVHSDSTIHVTPRGQSSTVTAVNDRLGFVYHLPMLLPEHNSTASRLSLVRQKHLSHIEALRGDGFDFLPLDAHQRLLSGPPATTSSPPMPPRAAWKDRLLSSAAASTLKIAGVGKKLKNKAILLRNALVPTCLNPPPPPVYHSFANPATPTPFANLPAPTIQKIGVQRIVCIRDLLPSLEQGSDSSLDDSSSTLLEHADDARSLMSTSRQRKVLSTLPEEDYADFASSISDEDLLDDPEPDVYVDAILMPVENLAHLSSPNRSRVSPPWVNKALEPVSGSLKPPQGGRPRTMSTARSSEFEFGGMSPVSSIMAHLHPEHARHSFMSSTDSSYGTNARRRSSSLVMLPLQGRPRSNTANSGRDKENTPSIREYEHTTFGKVRTPVVEQIEDEEEEDGEEQEYYVFEAADPEDDGTEDGKRESVIVLLPVPKAESEQHHLRSRWSSTVGSVDEEPEPEPVLEGELEGLETYSNPFLTPHPNGKPLPSLPPSSRRTSYVTASEAARPSMSRNVTATSGSSRYQTPSSVTPAVSKHPSHGQPARSRRIMSLREMDLEEEEPEPVPVAVPRPQEPSKKKAPRPLTPLEWTGGAPVPVPSPSFPTLSILAPPAQKRNGRSEEDLITPRAERFSGLQEGTRNRSSSLSTSTFGGGSGKRSTGEGTPRRPPPRLIAERIDAPSPPPQPVSRPRSKSAATTTVARSTSRSSSVKTPTQARSSSRPRNATPALPRSQQNSPAPVTPTSTPKIKPRTRIPPPNRPPPPPPPPRMSDQAKEFLKSSGKAFMGQPFQAIEVLNVDSGETEVFVDGKARPKSFTSRAEASTTRTLRQRPSV